MAFARVGEARATSRKVPVDPNSPTRDYTADLVIVSGYMPKDAGAQSIRDIQAAHPGTPLIAISGQFRSGSAGPPGPRE